ncbi:predicted protein, partial [Naegleria gruberi]
STPGGNNNTSNGTTDPTNPTSNNTNPSSNNTDPSTPGGNNSTGNNTDPSTPGGNNNTSNGTADPTNPTSNNTNPSTPGGNNSTNNGTTDPTNPTSNNTNPSSNNTNPSTPGGNNSGNNSTSNGTVTDKCTDINCVHGSCIDGACQCETGYTGSLCDQAITSNNTDKCADINCVHGSCSEGVCQCETGYTGSLCDQAVTSNNTDKCADINCVHGSCIDGVCQCETGYTGSLCDQAVTSNNTDKCADINCVHGSCIDGVCQCETGYTGTLCDQAVDPCTNIKCGSHGSCSKGVCVCTDGYTGSNCETAPITCNGKSEAEGGCSFHGTCSATDKCICNGNFDSASFCSKCKTGYTGSDCSIPVCFNVPSTSSSVCSGKGSCTAPDSCVCASGYSGKTCSSFSCWGIDKSNSTVCGGSSKGTCVGPNKCSCVSNWNNLENTCVSCSPAYTGETCTQATCSANTTCSSHGSCDEKFKCVCSGNWDGEFCNVCKAGFVGDNCDIACSASTCNGNGVCTKTGACLCVGHYDSAQKCAAGKCADGFQGSACDYKVDSSSFAFNQFGDRIIATVYTSMKKSVNCSQVFTSVATLGAGVQCNMDGVSKLEVVLGAGATVKLGDSLQVYTLLGDVSNTVSVTVKVGSFVAVAPTAYLTTDKAVVSTCDTVTLNAFDSVSTDRRPLNFAWTCTAAPTADAQTTLNNALKVTSSGVRLNLVSLGLVAGTYTVQVTVTSSFSASSSSKSVSFTVTASPAPGLSIKEGSVVEYLIGTTSIITPVISFPTCYTGNGSVAYSFAYINSIATPTIVTKDNMVVIAKTSTAISTVGDYYIVVTAAANGASEVSTTVRIKAVAKPLTVTFSVPDMTQSKDDAVDFTVNIVDPSDTTGTLAITSTCVDADGNTCVAPAATESASFSKSLPAGKYTFTTTGTKDIRTTTAKLTITVVDTAKDKIIRVSITSNTDLSTVDPTKDLYLTYNTLDALSTSAKFTWTCDSGDSSTSSLLTVSKANMVPGATYTASLNIVDGVKSGSAIVSFTVNAPPTKGIFEAYPLSGAALSDSFDLKCGNGWSDPQSPLKFQFLYLDAASNNWVSLTEKTEQQSTKVQLPSPSSGDSLKVKAIVFDALGASTESEQLSISITKPSTADATKALSGLAESKGTITLSAASSAMSVIGTVDLTTATAEQKTQIATAAAAIADAFISQQTKTEAVTSVSAASAENSLSFTASLASSVSKGLVSDATTSKVVSNLASTTTKVVSASSVSLSDSVLDSTKKTADNFYGYISGKVSARVPPVSSLRAFSKVDLDNLNSVYSSVASLKTKDAVPDAPAATVTSNGLTTVSRKVNLATLASESQVVSGKNKITFKSAIAANSALASLKSVTYAVKTTTSTVTSAASKSIDFSISNGASPVAVSDSAAIADLVFELSAKRSVAATTYTCNKITNGVAAADSTCTIVVGTDGTVTASVKSTGVYVLTASTPVTPAATKSAKVNAAPSMGFSALVALIAAVVAAL